MNNTTKKAPADVGASLAGANQNHQVQDTPEMPSRQELKKTIGAVAMAIARLRIELTEEFGGEEAYRMLIKMFQLACMSSDTLHAEARAAEMYLAKEKN